MSGCTEPLSLAGHVPALWPSLLVSSAHVGQSAEKRGQNAQWMLGSFLQWKGGLLQEEKAGWLTFEMYFLLKGLILFVCLFSNQPVRNILCLVWTFPIHACLQSGKMGQGSC